MHFMDVRIYSYCKDGVFTAVTAVTAEFKIRHVKGVPLVTRGYTKGVPFLSKMVHTKGKRLVLGASLFGEYPPPPPPFPSGLLLP